MIRVKKDKENKRIKEEQQRVEEETKGEDNPQIEQKVRKSPGEIRLQKEI